MTIAVKDRRLILLYPPSWVLPGAAADFWFSQGLEFGGDIASNFSITRAQTVTSYASTLDGLLIPFAANTLRITNQGLLVEESRTNLILQSQTFQTTWTNTNVNDATFATVTTAPDATNTAQKLTETTTNGLHSVQQSVTKAASALAYSYTVYAKQSDRTRLYIQIDDNAGNGAGFTADLAGAQVGVAAAGVGVAFTSISASVVSVGQGFVRCTITATSNTATTIRAQMALDNGSGTGAANHSYAGTNGNGAFIWGAQLEQAAFQTSYIPTTTVAVARAADNISLIGAAKTAILGSSFTVAAKFISNNSAGDGYAISVTPFTNPTNASGLQNTNLQGGWFTGAKSILLVSRGTNNTLVIAFDELGNFSGSANGANLQTSASSAYTGGTGVSIGSADGTQKFIDGPISRLVLYNTKLSNATIVGINLP